MRGWSAVFTFSASRQTRHRNAVLKASQTKGRNCVWSKPPWNTHNDLRHNGCSVEDDPRSLWEDCSLPKCLTPHSGRVSRQQQHADDTWMTCARHLEPMPRATLARIACSPILVRMHQVSLCKGSSLHFSLGVVFLLKFPCSKYDPLFVSTHEKFEMELPQFPASKFSLSFVDILRIDPRSRTLWWDVLFAHATRDRCSNMSVWMLELNKLMIDQGNLINAAMQYIMSSRCSTPTMSSFVKELRKTWTSKFQDYHILLWSYCRVPAFENWFRKSRTTRNDMLFNETYDRINQSFNPFSPESKEMIHEVGNIELCELLDTEPKMQCKVCLSYWDIGIVYCTCGHFLRKGTEENKKFILYTMDLLSILTTV